MVIPDGHNEDHSLLKRLAHGGKTSLGLVLVLVTEGGLLSVTPSVGDRVTGEASNGSLGVGNDLSVLNVKALDLGERVADELGDNSKLLAGIDSHTLSIEVRAPIR